MLDCAQCVALIEQLTAEVGDPPAPLSDPYPWPVAYIDAEIAMHVAELHPRLVPPEHTDCQYCAAYATATDGKTDQAHLIRDFYLPKYLH